MLGTISVRWNPEKSGITYYLMRYDQKAPRMGPQNQKTPPYSILNNLLVNVIISDTSR